MFKLSRSMIVRTLAVAVTAMVLVNLLTEAFRDSPDYWPYRAAMLVRTLGDERVYYIENGNRHWIDSSATFRAHGFSWDAIRTISPEELAVLPEGEQVEPDSPLVLPGEEMLLPDLIPFPAEELKLDIKNGRNILRFSSVFWNQGGGPLEVLTKPSLQVSTDTLQDAFQRIKDEKGAERLKLAGHILWHAIHKHYHLGDVMDYILETEAGATVQSATKEKVTFCMRDDRSVDLNMENAPKKKDFGGCKKGRQGVSVGWADVYRYTLPDQYLDVHDLAEGTYRLRLVVNPRAQMLERRIDNNQSMVLFSLDLSGKTLKVIGKAAPFSRTFSFPNGTFISQEGSADAYIVHNNKKRLLREGQAGVQTARADTLSEKLPRSIMDAIPVVNVVSASGGTVFALNDKGYKRPFPDAQVLASYGFDRADIVELSAEELALYPDARYIKRAGQSSIYTIDGGTKKAIDEEEEASASVDATDATHIVNEADFNAYVTQI